MNAEIRRKVVVSLTQYGSSAFSSIRGMNYSGGWGMLLAVALHTVFGESG